jgi:hypothetical protein
MIRIIDNFYEDPSRLTVLQSEFNKIGCGVGLKSPMIEDLDINFYREFKHKIYNIHNLPMEYKLTTYFTEYKYNPIPELNNYCAHIDGRDGNGRVNVENYKLVLCGQIFLSEGADRTTGLSFYRPNKHWDKSELFDRALNDYLEPKNAYNAGKISLNEYIRRYDLYHSDFDKTIEVNNVYNRMVSWDGGTVTGSKMTSMNNSKIVQNFYVERI